MGGYVCSYLLRKPLAILKKDFEVALNVDVHTLAVLDFCFYLPYAGVSLFFGWVADTVGARHVFAGGLIIGAVAFALIPPFTCCVYIVALLYFTIGTTLSLGWPSGGAILVSWFTKTARNTAFGLYGTSIIVGGLLATILTTHLREIAGWDKIFLPFSICSIIVAIIVFIISIIKETNSTDTLHDLDVEKLISEKEETSSNVQMSFFQAIRLPMMMELSLSMFFIKIVRYSFLLWLPYFLESALNYSNYDAGMYSCIFDVGCGVGSVFNSHIKTKLFRNSNIVSLVGCSAISAVSLLLFYFTSSLHAAIYLSMVASSGMFLFAAEVILGGPLAADIGTKHGAVNSVISVINGFGSVGSLAQGPIISIVSSWFGWMATLPVLSLAMFLSAIVLMRIHQRDSL